MELRFSASKSYTSSREVSTGMARSRFAGDPRRPSGFVALPDGRQISPRRPMTNPLCEIPGSLDDLGQHDAGFDPETLEHVGEVLSREIARGAGRVGTSSQTAGRSVEGRDPALEPRIDVGESGPSRIVKVQGEHAARDAGFVERLDDVVDARRGRDADRVAERDLVDRKVEKLVGDLPNRFGRDRPLVGAPEDGRNVASYPNSLLPGPSDNRSESLDRLVHTRIDVVA